MTKAEKIGLAIMLIAGMILQISNNELIDETVISFFFGFLIFYFGGKEK